MFWLFGCKACGILAPWPGIELAPPALKGKVLTTGLSGKSLGPLLIMKEMLKPKWKLPLLSLWSEKCKMRLLVTCHKAQTHFTRLQLPMTDIFQAGIRKFFCLQLGFSGKRIHLQCRRHEFKSWGRKISQRRKWQPTPVFLPGKSPGQRSLTGYSP